MCDALINAEVSEAKTAALPRGVHSFAFSGTSETAFLEKESSGNGADFMTLLLVELS